MSLGATILDSTDIRHLHHLRRFCCMLADMENRLPKIQLMCSAVTTVITVGVGGGKLRDLHKDWIPEYL